MWERKDKKKEKPSKKFTPKYEKPKVLFIDLPRETLDIVRSAGFNALAGTFGSPYKVTLGDQYQPVVFKASLPNYTEQEIIIIDLTAPETVDSPEGEKVASMGENDWWAKCSQGKIDPRPRVMGGVQEAFNRILDHGGLFVIFAKPRISQEIVWAKNRYGVFDIDRRIDVDNWSFLSILSSDNLRIHSDYGQEINVPNYNEEIFRFLRKFIKGAIYEATFNSTYRLQDNWVPILNNKYERCVGGLIAPKDSKGRLLILPQLSNKAEAIVTLLREVLSDISPHLFPHIEGGRWVERNEYELDSVLKYKDEKIKVQQRAKKELEYLDKKITDERAKLGFLHGIITETGRDLVTSVKSCLALLGFEQILDIDRQILRQNTSGKRQEDLQVHDISPTLIIEVTGLSGLPREADTLQVVKYVSRRMKEWKRTDVHGVSIVNHQRNIPALERDNDNVFTTQQIEDAKSQDITLLTTWDLFLLIKGMLKWGWNPKAIQELFYKSGRMSRVPTIYKPIGKIVNYWERIGVVGVQISGNVLHKGERIGYITPEGYLEEEALSLQIENQDVEEAPSGQLVGIKTIYPKNLLCKGMIVYRVTKQE